ncbi:MAG: hypothetical protein WCK84_02060 [Bacteroidota bacterium]
MKKAFFSLSFFFSFVILFAQTSPEKPKTVKNHHLGLEFSAGYSIVMGNFGAIDKANKKAGYATNGWQMQFTFDWMGKKDFGLALQYTFQKNPLSNSTEFLVPDGWPTGTLGPGSWSSHYLMAGPVFMKTIKRIHVDAKILGGVIVCSSSNFSTPNPTDTTGMKIDVNLGTGFGYGISAGFGYAFSSHVALKFNLSLMGGWPGKNKQYGSQLIGYEKYTEPSTGIIYTRPIYSAPVEYEIKKVVFTLNPSLGLVYRF